MFEENVTTIRKALAFMLLLVFVVSLIMAYLNQADVPGLYSFSNGEIDAKYYVEISPAPRAFAIIWPIIYLWNAAAIFYICISVFLPENKSPVNFQPSIVTIPFLICYMLTFGITIGWLFAYDRQILGLAFFLLLTASATCYTTLALLCKSVFDNLPALNKEGHGVMLWLVRILIQNGIGLPCTWLTIATFLNLTEIVIYVDSLESEDAILRGNISIEDGSTAILSVLFTVIITWFILDCFVFFKYTRYVFTIFPVLILAFSGIVAKLRFQERETRNLIYASVVLGLIVLAALVRIGLFIFRTQADSKITVELEKKTSADEEKA